MPEETYYWNYSRHLDFGYLDHPPMVAWLIKAGTALFGQTEFGVRAGALCCGAITSIFVYKLTRNLFGQAAALAALLLTQALPYFFLSGFLMTPDAPLAAAWAASLYFLERALIGDRSRAWWLAGICLGFGMISKYSIGILGAVAAAFMLWDQDSRIWWRAPGTLCRRPACAGNFLSRHHLECAARLGLIRVSNFAKARRVAAVRPAQTDCLHDGADHADGSAGPDRNIFHRTVRLPARMRRGAGDCSVSPFSCR